MLLAIPGDWQIAAASDIPRVTVPPRSIVLIGFMGSGKSSVGRRLAQQLGWPRVDLDQMIAAAMGMTIAEIFQHCGEARFRHEESAMLAKVDATSPAVIVTGGGIVLRPANVSRLRALGIVVWLTAAPAVLQERLSRTRPRPLLQTPDPAAAIVQLLAEREQLYAAAADHTVDTSELEHAQVAQAVRRAIEN